MRKTAIWLLLAAMVLGAFTGCNSANEPTEPTQTTTAATQPDASKPSLAYDPTVQGAVDYLKDLYPHSDEPTRSQVDHVRTNKVQIGEESFTVEWAVDVTDPQIVRIIPGKGGICTVDVNSMYTEEVPYTLTATVTDAAGNSLSQDWKYILPRYLDALNIFEPASQLAEGESLPEACKVTATVLSIDIPYNPEYDTITVTLQFGDGQLVCSHMRSGDAQTSLVAVGDTVTVKGIIKNDKGTVKFGSGCVLLAHTPA